eukprot:jgi/Mesvir1/28981/Mv17754-RA.1
MASEDEIKALEAEVAKKREAATTQGDTVRALKAAKADKDQIAAAIEALKNVKLELEAATKAYEAKAGAGNKALSLEAFRSAVCSALERRLFYIPAFKIYGGVAGLYDYGPPGCAVKANVLNFWKQHFVLEESMLELECPSVTPEAVLKASGHVDRFTDLMVKDVVNQTCFRADHLLKEAINKFIADAGPGGLTPEKKEECLMDLARVDEYKAEELGERLKAYGVKAPDTGNGLTDPFPFNLMFQTTIGPTGTLIGYMRPETAQGIFVNFRDLLYYNGSKLPFAVAQIGQAFRNEISPRAGLLRVREFTMAEIEHFLHPQRKNHPKFVNVADLVLQLYPRAEQLGPKKPVMMRLGDAVGKGTVANETLGYFIARTYLFLIELGIVPEKLRFRQHLQHEMAHYACDCWDAEIECSYGWVECVGLADRSAYDLTAHTEKSKVDLTAFEAYPEPKLVEALTVTPNLKEMGKTLKKDAKIASEALVAMSEAEATAFKAMLDADGKAPLTICTTGQTLEITAAMVDIKRETKKVTGDSFTPSVIEPSFGIGRIIYCLYEHTFYTREGDEARTVFRFKPLVAPIKCTVFPLQGDDKFDAPVERVSKLLTAAGLSSKTDTTGASIGKRYARTDELGVPFAVTVDYTTLADDTITLRERDTCTQVRLPITEVAGVVRLLVQHESSWEDVQAKYPAAESKEKD